MKPVYLEFYGVNSFSEKAEVDFRALISGGVFGIFGDTGSGKSTLLDCIHLALYGRTERSGNGGEYINYKSDSAYVLFDFEITTEGKRHTYRVRRERKRKNNLAKAFLYEIDEGGNLLAIAEGTRDVDDALEKIIGLTFADFKMCIALPQGDFAALVKAPTAERVKLVSRLFDLEKYGEKLSKAVNDKYYKLEEEVNLILAKMGQNEGASAEAIEEVEGLISFHQKALSEQERAFEEAENAVKKWTELQKARTDYENLERKFQALLSKEEEMKVRLARLENLPRAKSVVKEAAALETNGKEGYEAEQKLKSATQKIADFEKSLQALKQKALEENFDEKIVEKSVKIEKVRGASADLEAEKRAQALYLASVREFNELKAKTPKSINFDEEIEKIEQTLLSLGEEDNLLDFIKKNCKNLLSQEICGEIRRDLKILSQKHPDAEEDILPLIAKYTPSKTETENLDIAQMQIAFREVEGKKKILHKQMDEIKKNKEDFAFNERQKEVIIKEGQKRRAEWELAKGKIEQIIALGELSALEGQKKALEREKQNLFLQTERTNEEYHACLAQAEKQKALLEKSRSLEKSLTESVQKALTESGFSSVEEAKGLLRSVSDEEGERLACKDFFEKFALVRHEYEKTDPTLFAAFSEEEFSLARARKAQIFEEREGLRQKIADEKARLTLLREKREKYQAFEKDLKSKEGEKAVCEQLRSLIARNKFLEFIASEYLQEICVSASKTLLSLTGGRYFLKYDKEFKVGDNLDGGNLRAVKTLSGGETFLVSLSLALSLAGAICLKSLRPIEFFFLDEGFGTLDEKLVDTVMDVLAKLSKNFAVGLISHVEELKHRIDCKLLVAGANEQSGSSVKLVKI